MKGFARVKTRDLIKVYLKEIKEIDGSGSAQIESKIKLDGLPNDQLKRLRLEMILYILKKALKQVEELIEKERKSQGGM